MGVAIGSGQGITCPLPSTNKRAVHVATIKKVDWITALRADSIKKLAEQQTIQPGLFDERDLAEVTSDDDPGERLIVCRNPLLTDVMCMLAYYVQWHLRVAFAELLFDDHQREAAEAKRANTSHGRGPARAELSMPHAGSGDALQEPHSLGIPSRGRVRPPHGSHGFAAPRV